MIIYCQKGSRRYDLKPIVPYVRNCWELKIVFGGELINTQLDSFSPPRRQHAWLFGPEHAHGWTTPQGSEAQIMVFHFIDLQLPPGVCPADSYLERHCQDTNAFEELCCQALELLESQDPLKMLKFQELEAKIITRFIDDTMIQNSRIHSDYITVKRVVSWFKENLEHQPTIEEAARISNMSVSSLRNIFSRELNRSPQDVLCELKLLKACALMRDTELNINEISYLTGYSTPSNFTRAFKNRFGQSPSTWVKSHNKPQYVAVS